MVPIKTVPGLNAREHFVARARRVKIERASTAWMLKTAARPELPCSVLLTRVAPSNGVDDDNLVGAMKAVRDQVAEWIGVDDRNSQQVRYCYAQRRGKWGVTIEFRPPLSAPAAFATAEAL